MTTNTNKHISDWAESVNVDITNTPFSSSVTNVQLALDALGSHALEGGLPIATTSQEGILYLATQQDIDNGTDPNKAVTPELLAYALNQPNATEAEIGWTRYATNTEALNSTFNTAAATPKNIHHVFEERNATELAYGTVRLSSSSQAVNGTNNTTATTPLRVKEMIDTFTDDVATATESVTGIVELATATQATAGVVRDGMAISPYTFTRANATESNFGTSRIATQAETNALTSDTRVITPLKLGNLNASTTQKGLVELATGSETKALSSSSRAVTPSGLNSLNAGTASKGLVELATTTEAKALSNTTKVLTPHSLNEVRATASDPSQYGLTRLSNSLGSTSYSSAASSYAAKLLNDRITDVENSQSEWEELYNYERSTSTSSVLSVSRDQLDGYEFRVVYRGEDKVLFNVYGIYSNYFLYGDVSGCTDKNSYYNAETERIELPASHDRFILVMRRRIPWLPTGYSYTSGGGGGGTSGGGGSGGGGSGGGGSIDPLRDWQLL